jgi:hypothetical protein
MTPYVVVITICSCGVDAVLVRGAVFTGDWTTPGELTKAIEAAAIATRTKS